MAKYDEEAAILFEDVGKTYKGGIVALDGINISIDQGEFVFITGASGAGKSTLMKLLTAEERATEGSVWLEDINVGALHKELIPYYRRKIGMVFQDYRLIASKTVFENVAFAMESVGQPAYEIEKRVPLLLAMVGLGDRMKAYPNELSGGEAQRVGIARAMANTPRLLVADEPTGNLDPKTSESIMTLLDDINRTGTMVIACTHDLDIVHKMNKRVIEMSYGQIVYDSAEETTFHVPEEYWDDETPEEDYASYYTGVSFPHKEIEKVELSVSTSRNLPPPPPRRKSEDQNSQFASTGRPLPPPPPLPRAENGIPSPAKLSKAISGSTSVLAPPPPRSGDREPKPSITDRPLPPPRLKSEVQEQKSVSTEQPLPPPRVTRGVPIQPLGSAMNESTGEASLEDISLGEATSREATSREATSREASLYAILNPGLDPFQDASLNPFLDPDSYPALDPTWGQLSESSKGVIRYEV